ncbi:MAG: hypothetical protein JNL08_07280 [Planctomycetes bacterium]|nr:hypothetical protein [Planctomycetota bacterium]
MPSVTASCFFVVFATVLPAQQPPADDPIAAHLARRLAVVDAAYEGKRAELQQQLESQLDAAGPADQERLLLELESFELGGILPASRPEPARQFAHERRKRLLTLQFELRKAAEAYARRGDDAAAAEHRTLLDDVEEQLELTTWLDLRCRSDFAAAVAQSGFAWQGASLASPAERGGVLRLPSDMDREGLIAHYQLRLEVERTSGTGPLRLFFALPDRPEPDRELAAVVFDDAGDVTRFDAVRASRSANSHQGRLLEPGKSSTIVLTCKNDRIGVEVDGQRVLDHDEVRHLLTPPAWGAKLGNRRSFHLVTEAGTQIRLLSASFRAVPPPAPDAPAAIDVTAGLAEDQMPLGRVWRGALDNGLKVTARVVARNQRARTATIDLRGSNGWNVCIPVRTDGRGADFTIGDVRRLDAKVRIYNESGKGKAGAGGMVMDWKWDNVRNHPCRGREKRVFEASFRSQ